MASVRGNQDLPSPQIGQQLARAGLPHRPAFASSWPYEPSFPPVSLVYSIPSLAAPYFPPLQTAAADKSATSTRPVTLSPSTPAATPASSSAKLLLLTASTPLFPTNAPSRHSSLPTSTSQEGNGQDKMTGLDDKKVLAIVLATVIPVVAMFSFAVYLCCRNRRRRSSVFKRGITPIGDDEIESWKRERDEEKDSLVEEGESKHRHHRSQDSATSVVKPASMIVYQNPGRMSGEELPQSPRSLHNYQSSVDMPPPVVFARAPNARPGLTDEIVQGDQAYIPPAKRHHSRLTKSISHTPRGHDRSSSSRIGGGAEAFQEHWHGQVPPEYQVAHPQQSAERLFKPSPREMPRHHRGYSSPANQQWRPHEEEAAPGGLSPRPEVHQSEIGRAIG